MDWYYVEQGKSVGPFSEDQFRGLVSSGRISTETLVWTQGMPQWRRYGDVYSGQGAMAPVSSTGGTRGHVCAECGNVFSPQDMVSYGNLMVCAACKPVFFQRLREGAQLPYQVNYGGFWIRFLAKFIDGLVMGVAYMAVQFILSMLFMGSSYMDPERAGEVDAVFFLVLGIGMIIQFSVPIVYNTLFVGKYAATPGKMAVGLIVVTSDMGRVTYARALARAFAEILSQIILYIGYIIAGFDEQKRTLHDHICDTRVVHKN